ncbi:vWA domain-containing protein [Frankia sp. AgW1.1]|uniref:vWA domain-containing protein n=1 Tax=Frankia sp. AgW1.1 TaxID=1836971 RepID=UPI001931FD38|nr:vWA domain-containing protein [Frankia sp. AgW1.1]MBL7487042.1 VWA domain-containing protein [Frankia sp. AgW1.1]
MPDRTHIALLVDRSGSMMKIRDDAQGGIAALLAEQKAQPGKATVSLHQFDNEYEHVYGPVAITDAPAYELHPRGMTALLDALGYTIGDTAGWIASLPEGERPDLVIVAVATDGQENASRESDRPTIRKAIDDRTAAGWQFAFLSADFDAVGEARDLGFAADASVGYMATAAGTRNAYSSLSASVSRSRSTGARLTVDRPDAG